MAAALRELAGEHRAGLRVLVEQEFEECLKLRFDLPSGTPADGLFKEFVVEMVIDRSSPARADETRPLQPDPSAMVKCVSMGKDCEAFIQNMPTGRKFLVAVVGKRPRGGETRSPWVRACTLSDKTRETELGNVDPMNMPRTSCERCPCPGYVPLRWSLNSAEKMRCRRCGCSYTDHTVVEVEAILRAREERACTALRRKSVTELPQDALEWDTRECNLWFWSDGAVHPRQLAGEHRPAPRKGAVAQAGGLDAHGGRKGRVSVVTPTTEWRQHFHEALWRVFEAQAWPDKELVVVETYADRHSEFFMQLAKTDSRLIYVKFQRPWGQDWSIGLKRNIGAHLATGEFIANFDDDDLYAPTYLTSMVTSLQDQAAQAITLSTWYIFDQNAGKFWFCDPLAWGLAKGLDRSSQEVKSKVYGYGFSYVFKRRAGLDMPYEDVNLGEDYGFITQLQHRRGDASVALLRDEFGVCVHVQHGGNTSNSIPLREVDRGEALGLDVVELAASFPSTPGRGAPVAPLGGLLSAAEPPSRRTRLVRARTPDGDLHVSCAINAAAEDFLADLEQQHPASSSRRGWRVYRVPPAGEAGQAATDQAAIDVLGLAFLAEMPEAEHNLTPEGACGKQWRQLLEAARSPMRGSERLGLRTQELWVRPPPVGGALEAVEADDAAGPEEFLVVDAACQKSTVKKFFSVSGAVQVRVPRGADVAGLRTVLGPDFPPKARVLAERPGRGLCTLQETDPVPDKVVLTDFTGRRGFYAKFTERENGRALLMIKDYFQLPENQAKVTDVERAAHGNEAKFGIIMSQLLAEEVYPPILRRFGLPDDQQPLHMTIIAMEGIGGDVALSHLWLETELLMRNPGKIRSAHAMVAHHRALHGLPPLALPQLAP